VISPIDLIPDVLPIIGVVDDFVIVPLAIRWLLNRLPPEIANAAPARVQSSRKPALKNDHAVPSCR
jgi:uncharacterized membrane protein YkvA (DUF1232 family)